MSKNQSNKQILPEPSTRIGSKKEKDFWEINFLVEQFSKESDRAAVILVSSLLDELIGSLLKSYFIPNPNSEDSLFSNATSPLSNFSSKIDLAFRLGLISSKFARDLHIVRKIRNSFAHDLYNCNFNNGSVKSRINELENSVAISKNINNLNRPDDLLKGARGMFLYITAHMVGEIIHKINTIKELIAPELEIIYN